LGEDAATAHDRPTIAVSQRQSEPGQTQRAWMRALDRPFEAAPCRRHTGRAKLSHVFGKAGKAKAAAAHETHDCVTYWAPRCLQVEEDPVISAGIPVIAELSAEAPNLDPYRSPLIWYRWHCRSFEDILAQSIFDGLGVLHGSNVRFVPVLNEALVEAKSRQEPHPIWATLDP
jgi:hypothetical protein